MRYFELTPAYGRDYKSAYDIHKAWYQGLDFEGDYQLGFKPVNLNDIPRPCTVMLRYRHNTRVTPVEVK